MAIRMKRGKLAELDTSLLRSGELVVATDVDFVAYAKGQSDIVELATKKEVIDMVKKGILVDVDNKLLKFTYHRVQPTVSFISEYLIGGTYDIKYGDGYTTTEYVIKEFLKVNKPQFTHDGNYETWVNASKTILNELKGVIRADDFIYCYCGRNSSGTISINVYYGEPLEDTFTISSAESIDSRIGRQCFFLSPSVRVYGNSILYQVLFDGTIRKTENQSTTYSVSRLGVYVYNTSVSACNLGLSADYISNDNDWEWDFSNCDFSVISGYSRAVDSVDGVLATFTNGATIDDGELVLSANSHFVEIPYMVQSFRYVEIEFGECERYHYTQYPGTVNEREFYPLGSLFGNYISNSSQYANPFTALFLNEWYDTTSTYPRMQIVGSWSSGEAVTIDDPNFLSNKKLTSHIDENYVWTVTIGDVSISYPNYNPYSLTYSRVGRTSGQSNRPTLYTTRIKKIKIK